MLASDRAAWGDFPAKLHAVGFTVLAVNVRSGAPLSDFTMMLQSLSSGAADPARLAVMGAGSGADMALLGCAGDLLCDVVMLLSPSDDQALLKAMVSYNPRPIFLSASQDDTLSFNTIQQLQSASTGGAFVQPFASAGHGTDLLVNRPDLGDLMMTWLQQKLVG